MKNKTIKNKLKINTIFNLWTIIISLSSFLVSFLICFILSKFWNIYDLLKENIFIGILILFISQIIINLIATILISNPIIKIMNEIERILLEITKGNYKVRLKQTKILPELSSNFNKMVSELDSVEILRSDFVNNFSHELKTPVVSIKGYAEELKKEDLSKEEKLKYLDIIIEESNRLSSLSTNILNLSKIEKQEILTEKEKVNIGEQIRKVILMEYKKIEKYNIDLDLDIDDCCAYVNKDLMEQVWINLLENAIKFNKEKGKIKVSVHKKENFIYCVFEDTGIGIEEDKQEHIFNKFYTTNNKKGNGLGLAMTKKILDLHQATIKVKSKKNKGTKFEIILSSE